MKEESKFPAGSIPEKKDGEFKFSAELLEKVETHRKSITVEDVKEIRKLFQNPPPSKVDDLAKLFKPYMTGESHDKLKADGIMPVGVVMNPSKIKDEEFLKLAIYSLDKHFNIRWLFSSSAESDAVIFVFIEAGFYTVRDIEMKKHISPVELYRLYPI